MLTKLTIENVALIERAEVEFGNGLNVLSGETGAGKSVILDSINFVLGAKADRSLIRSGTEFCSVCAVFAPGAASGVFSVLQEMGIEADDALILSRKYRADGRGDIKVNGCSVNTSMLRRITSALVDVHGQSEHFFLLAESNQLKLIDRVAGAALLQPKQELSALLAENKKIAAVMQSLGGDERERGRRIDILQYQMNEIDAAALKEGEEEELAERKLFFANAERVIRALSEAAQAMSGEGAAVDLLRSARRSLADAAPYGKEYAALEERLESAALESEDIAETLAELCGDTVYDEREAEIVEQRLDLIHSLKKKYGDSVQKILAYREQIGEEYDLLVHSDRELAAQVKKYEANLKNIYVLCRTVTQVRETAAKGFCERVEKELRTLNIANARFCAEFRPYAEEDTAKATAEGLDSMQFLFSANAGEPLKPLSKVISGGEMSRLMLAIKTQSDGGEAETYLFDEIDAGISGRTARTVAEKFAAIAQKKQIIAVSHLAQIAAMADENFLIEKRVENGQTRTQILPLGENERREEIVRLLGGSGGEAAHSLADELIGSAAEYKRSIAGK